jgi:hypothetical protein
LGVAMVKKKKQKTVESKNRQLKSKNLKSSNNTGRLVKPFSIEIEKGCLYNFRKPILLKSRYVESEVLLYSGKKI